MSGHIHSGVEDVCEQTISQKFEEPESLTFKFQTSTINAVSSSNSKFSSVTNDCILQPYFCELCNVRAFSQKIYQNHLEGRKHIKREQRNGKIFKCDLCEVTANGQTQLETHLRSIL